MRLLMLFCFSFFTCFVAIKVIGIERTVSHTLSWNGNVSTSQLLSDSIHVEMIDSFGFFVSSYSFSGNVKPSVEMLSFESERVSSLLKMDGFTTLPFEVDVRFKDSIVNGNTVITYKFPVVYREEKSGEVKRVKNINLKLSADDKSTNQPTSIVSKHSLLSRGEWYKFEIPKSGVYQLSNSMLRKNGISVSKSVRVFTCKKNIDNEINKTLLESDLQECPVQYFVGDDGLFNKNDFLFFWAEGSDSWRYNEKDVFFDHSTSSYTTKNFVFVLIDDDIPLNIPVVSSPGDADHETNSYDVRDFHEKNKENVLGSGREYFELLREIKMSFSFKNLLTTRCKIKTRVIRNSPTPLTLKKIVNNKHVRSFGFQSFSSENYKDTSVLSTFPVENDNISLTLSVLGASSEALCYLDYAVINARAQLSYNNEQLLFRDVFSQGYNTTRYSISSTKPLTIWNVTNSFDIKRVDARFQNSTLVFAYNSQQIEEFVAFSYDDCLLPTLVGKVENQDLHGLSGIDMVIVSADDYLPFANRIASLHERVDGIKSVVVTQSQVFNEFSGGRVDPYALRDFIRYLYFKDGKRLKYLLLYGDGSYDNMDLDTRKYVITYESKESLSADDSFVSDDYFCLLDTGEGTSATGNIEGTMDVAQGRLPAANVDQASILANKIEDYVLNNKCKGAWRNKLLFLADDADENQRFHMESASELADNTVRQKPSILADKVFLDAYPQVSVSGGQRYPVVNKIIESKVKNGCLVFNYTGHGNPLRMAGEIVVEKKDVDKWENKHSLPLFITASCQIGRFDDKKRVSLGENILLKQHGGGIALITTTRLVYAFGNNALSQKIYDTLFSVKNDGSLYSIGEVLMNAKNSLPRDMNKFNFTLLGDPALHLSIPKMKVKTDKIIDNTTGLPIDTIKAFSRVTIEGHVEDRNGNKFSARKGVVVVTVFDKPRTVRTLNNDGADPIEFNLQDNIIFKGNARVTNGDFSISFIVPKDIYYHYGNGKINYYYSDEDVDGAGSYTSFKVGGASNYRLTDDEGPLLKVFLNDTTFESGGITDPSPMLLISAFDENGINISGASIGHDAVAVFDNNGDQIVLNEFYEAEVNTYKKGIFRYPVSQLTEGEHSVRVTVWDINNNVSEGTLSFFVSTSIDLVIKHVLNFPNPVATSTNFLFEHNQEDQMLDVTIQVYTISGQLLKTLAVQTSAEGYRSVPIPWDGKDDNGVEVGKGVYVYKLRVRNEIGKTAFAVEKLVVVK